MNQEDWMVIFVAELRTALPRLTEQAARDIALQFYDKDKEPRAAAHQYYMDHQIPASANPAKRKQ
jgi:hypothetical protein